MDAFESLIYEHILSQLFEMVQQYDFADEVGRKELKPLITKLLSEQKFNSDFVAQLVKLLSQITEIKTLCDEVSVLISDIHEPLITVEPTKETTIIKEFKVGELLLFKSNFFTHGTRRMKKRNTIKGGGKESIKTLNLKNSLLLLQQ